MFQTIQKLILSVAVIGAIIFGGFAILPSETQADITVLLADGTREQTSLKINLHVTRSTDEEVSMVVRYWESGTNPEIQETPRFSFATEDPTPTIKLVSIRNLKKETTYVLQVIDAEDNTKEYTKKFELTTAAGAGDALNFDIENEYLASIDRCEDNNTDEYCLLAPIPGLTSVDTSDPKKFGKYINTMFTIFIGVAILLALIMLMLGAIQYMSTDAVMGKEDSKKRMWTALGGLVLGLSAWLILNTINSDLLRVNISIPEGDERDMGTRGTEINVKNESDGRTITIKAGDRSQMETVNVFNTSVEVYKGLVPSLRRINEKWAAACVLNKPACYRVKTIEGYYDRVVAGTNKKSGHAFGLAIDINSSTNPHLFDGRTETDMPPEFRQLFLDEGWGWGGAWTRSKDAMHFSKLENEDGDLLVELPSTPSTSTDSGTSNASEATSQ